MIWQTTVTAAVTQPQPTVRKAGQMEEDSWVARSKEAKMEVGIRQQPHTESEFKIDGSEVTQLSFIGQIHTISSQATNHTFQLDDGTGLVDVKQWIDIDQDPATARPLPKEGEYVHVWGRLKAFNNKRHVGAHVIRPVTDFNEVNCHLLEATAVHLYFVRGPPETPGMKNEGGAQGMFVDSYGTTAPQANGGGKKLPAGMSAAAKQVFNLLQSAEQSNEGLHVSMIASRLSMQANDVFKAGDELLADGLIYTTVDDETWAVLEY
ncbi:hypothetical protein EG329_010464 [Mollisiaceae sp. DMI_Dod_QoI]|nr:hypothetical protein EG329_010464 [Helotiales sp. DMI_Dod_QoI]